MARERNLFFDSIFKFLNRLQTRTRRRLPAIAYGLLIMLGLISAMVLPGFAKSLIDHSAIESTAAIAQGPAQPSSELANAQQSEQQAREHYTAGRFSDAANEFERAALLYQQSDNLEQAKASQVNQARALQALGLHSRAIMILQAVLQTSDHTKPLLEDLSTIQTEIRSLSPRQNACELQEPSEVYSEPKIQERLSPIPASPTTVFALRSLGDALQIAGDLEQSRILLLHSRALAEQLNLADALAATDLSLGNLARTQAIATLKLNNMTPDEAIAQLQRPPLSPIQAILQCRRTTAAQEFLAQTNRALEEYQQAANPDISPPLTQAQARLNALTLLLERQQWSEAAATVPAIYPLLDSLPASRAAVYAHINLVESLMRLAENSSTAPPLQAEQLLATAQQQASTLGVAHTESYVLGITGELYKQKQQWSAAKASTQQALLKVDAISATNLPLTVNDTDLAYRWYRQLGQILKAEGNTEDAIAAYEKAVDILQKHLRLDVASSNLNYKTSFRQETQQPVYKELMDLLLQAENPSNENLKRVRQVSTSLIEGELTTFLQEPCTVATPQEINQIVDDASSQQKAAVIYPIVLPDRLEVIVRLPGDEQLRHARHMIEQEQLSDIVTNLKLALEEDYTFEAVKELSSPLYEWIVKPFEGEFTEVDTLVFTLDSELQSVPMAALYVGNDATGNEKYLINEYAIAEFLGLPFQNVNESSRPQTLKIIAAGLSTVPELPPNRFQNQFQPLENVIDELEKIKDLEREELEEISNIRTSILLDEDFTLTDFNRQLNEDSFQVVHLATHGQFSANPAETFLLANEKNSASGNKRASIANGADEESEPSRDSEEAQNVVDSLVELDELGILFRVRGRIREDSIELLVLNACETATGDDLATLGLAGTAIRAGANSAIASLWTLEDRPSVDFSEMLYKNLGAGLSKAEALQKVQLELMQDPRYQHPRYWAPYILAGNWLPLTASEE